MDEAYKANGIIHCRVAGVYFHIPFCQSRCLYCDFFSTTSLSLRTAYVNALKKEMHLRSTECQNIRTVYFGGGTPSLLSGDEIGSLLKELDLSQATEITVEANPGDITPQWLERLQQAGVNRLSIGIQSFHDSLLHLIGRRHNAQQARQAVKMAQQVGFNNISIDLIYGLPSQTLQQWENEVEEALKLDIQHLSCYCLTYEEGTPLTKMLNQGQIPSTDDDIANAMYDNLSERLAKAGFEHYEVSNFAKKGCHSQHNSAYWNQTPYVGFGAGAHSYDGNRTRRANISDLNEYISSPGGKRTYLTETLSDTDLYNERIMLGLRTAYGIDVSSLTPLGLRCAQKYIEEGKLRIDGSRIVATQEGLHLLNRIIEDLFE